MTCYREEGGSCPLGEAKPGLAEPGHIGGTRGFVLQEIVAVFSYLFSTQEQENTLVALPSGVSLLLPHAAAPSS